MIRSVDPYRLKVIAQYDNDSIMDIRSKLNNAMKSQVKWAKWSLEERRQGLLSLMQQLQVQQDQWAAWMAEEMGKPVTQGKLEVQRCIQLCQHYYHYASEYLASEKDQTDTQYIEIHRRPYGVWLAVMPWNFPMWQVFRCAIPALLAGNTVVLKHSRHVSKIADQLSQLMQQSWDLDHLFQWLKITPHELDEVLSHPAVAGVSLTGSEDAGRSMAAMAGRQLKISILELGGSNALVIDETANVEQAVQGILVGRLTNSGQSCIAAKRILIHESLASAVLEALKRELPLWRVGDPLSSDTKMGPLVSVEAAEQLEGQVKRGMHLGAEGLLPFDRNQATVQPCLYRVTDPENPLWKEETFGPVVVFMTYADSKEAMRNLSHPQLGLGASIYTSDIDSWTRRLSAIQEPQVVFNDIVRSYPHLPFGGLKKSGYGLELGRAGIQSFTYPQVVARPIHPIGPSA